MDRFYLQMKVTEYCTVLYCTVLVPRPCKKCLKGKILETRRRRARPWKSVESFGLGTDKKSGSSSKHSKHSKGWRWH